MMPKKKPPFCADPNERKLTWGEILTHIEAAGVKPEDEVDLIEIYWGLEEDFEFVKDEVFGWQIRL
ncbi:MAG: hypothetical protein GC149_07530 [Gammaproteobacteria bacterium]|nr:hypothetical protein [Gammaproteobacteria bacterium]